MQTTEAVLIGLALAMDCFTISIASGAIVKKAVYRPMIAMILAFGLFQGGMTLGGWAVSNIFSKFLAPVDHWIAFALLAYMGGKMIWQGFKKDEDEKFNPLDTKVILTMAVATSIDAMAVGVSMAFMQMNTIDSVLQPSLIIALLSSLMTVIGLATGIHLGKKIPFAIEPIGGCILVGIGVKILIEHLA